MDSRRIKIAAFILAFALLIISLINTFQLQTKINDLKSQLSTTESNLIARLENRIASLEGQLQQQKIDVQELLEKQQSLFDEASVDISFQDNKMLVSITAVPKMLAADEKFIAQITADEKQYETGFDESGNANIAIDLAETIKPTLVIQSDSAVKQESLGVIRTTDLMMVSVFSEWHHISSRLPGDQQNLPPEDGDEKLDLWLIHGSDSLNGNDFLHNAEIEKAEFVIFSRGVTHNNSGDVSAIESIDSWLNPDNIKNVLLGINDHARADRLPAKEITDSSTENLMDKTINTLGYQADVTAYASRQDGHEYEIYFILTLKNGIKLASLTNPVATFSFSENNHFSSYGSDRLTPIFP